MSDQQLALAVIEQALGDACLPWQPPGAKSLAVKNYAIAEAIAFFADTDGEWAESREAWCDAAGMDPDAARQAGLRRIAEARGGSVIQDQSWRSHLAVVKGHGERRELAAKVFAAYVGGKKRVDLRVEFGVGDNELKKLLELGRLHSKRNAAARA
jgi:hypothetical protein